MRTLLLALSLLATSPVYAQQKPPALVVRLSDDKPYQAITIEKAALEVHVVGLVAETRLSLTFRNPFDRQLEGTLYFPLPEGATVSGYALDVGGVMVDGVVVEKEKARVVFEKEVRKGVDPGLIEWTQGNNFKTRVYPIPARGTRTVAVRFVSALAADATGATYRLPLNFPTALTSFALQVAIDGVANPPKVSWPGKGGIQFVRQGEGFSAHVDLAGTSLVGPLSLSVPNTELGRALVERSPWGEMHFAVQDFIADLTPAGGRKPATRITVLWDASNSRRSTDHAKEIEVLRAYLAQNKSNRVDVDLVVFRNAAAPAEHFVVQGGACAGLCDRLSKLAYDGGTQLAAMSPDKSATPPDFYLLVSDGMSNFGDAEPRNLRAPVYAVSADASVNGTFLNWLAQSTGGAYFNLSAMPADRIAAALGQSVTSVLSIEASGGEVSDVLPRPGAPIVGALQITGKLKSATATLTVKLGSRGQVQKTLTYALGREHSLIGDVLARLWAQQRVWQLAAFPRQNEQALVALGKKYGLVTPGTSLIVLERLEQYVEHEIPPPAGLAEMRAEYDRIMRDREQARAGEEQEKLTHILELWQRRIEWWSTKFTYPKNFRYNDTSKRKEGGGGGSGEAMERRSASGMADESMAAPSAAPPAPEAKDMDDAGPSKEAAAKPGEPEPEPVSEGAIEMKSWEPDTPYLRALKAAVKDKLFEVYMAQKQEYGAAPSFFLDCADFFAGRKMNALALQVLSNVAELELESAPLLRILGHRLDQVGELELAAKTFEEVLRLRTEEPQSFRDLALVLAHLKQFERAMQLLAHVVMNRWDRFDEIEVIALMELNDIVPQARAAGIKEIPLDKRLVKLLNLDVRISLTWDADLTDIDLWVEEPSGERADYSHQLSTIGGLVSRDFTQGYGPEEYVLRRAMPGTYTVKVNFYGSQAQALSGAVTLQLDLYTQYGKPNEKHKSITVRLTETKETLTIGSLTF